MIGAFFAIENPIGKFADRAYIDFDTHARNRNAYEQDLILLKDRIKNEKIKLPMAYVLCDINGLKTVNDTFGHLEGDKLIMAAAEVLMNELKSATNIYRIGGDEFAVIYEGVDASIVERELDSVPSACEKISVIKKLQSPLSLSVGADWYEPSTQIEDCVHLADKKMYKAKSEYYLKNGLERRKH